MALFTVPLVLNDGTDDRTFDWLRQVPGQISGLYEETAATAQAASRLVSAHLTEKANRKRHLLQSTERSPLVNPGENDPADDLIIVNLTISHHAKANPVEVEKRLKLVAAAAGIAGFTIAMMKEQI